MSGFGQDLQRLLVPFLPCLGQWCQVPPRPLSGCLAWPLGSGLGWEHTLRTSVLAWLFRTTDPRLWHSPGGSGGGIISASLPQ